MKKFISLLMVTVLLCSFYSVAAFGAKVDSVKAGDPAFKMGDVTCEAGKTVDLPVTLSNNPGLCTAKLTISYNKSLLELVSATNGTVLTEGFTAGGNIAANPYSVVWNSGTKVSSANGTLVTFKFKVKDGVAGGTKATVSLTYDRNNTLDGNLDPFTVPFQTKDGTITVNTVANSYTVTYNANGGSVSPSSKTVTAGSSVTLPTPTKAYTITYDANGGSGAPSAQKLTLTCKGWSTSSSATSASYSCGSQYTPSGNVTLYAVWSSPVSATLSSTKPTRSGYKFLGWANSSSATSATYSSGESVSVSGSKTLYAVWEKDSGSSDSGSSSGSIIELIRIVLSYLALPFIPLIAFIMTILDLIF